MRRAVCVLLSALLSIGLTARPATAAAADHLVFAVTPITNMQAGTLFNVQVEARDSGGVVDVDFAGAVTLNASALGGSDFTAGNVVSATAGVATFTVFLNNAANNYSITASSPGLTPGASNVFNVTATHLSVLAVANVRAGDPFNVTAQARDANDNVAENFNGNVTLDAGATGGSNFVGGTLVDIPASAGTATIFGVVLTNAADGYTITASSTGLTSGVSNSFSVGARGLVITNLVANMKAGTAFNVTVQARDADNALAENFNRNVTLSASANAGGSNFVGGNAVVAATNGTVAFNGLALNDAASNYTIIASATGVFAGFSESFNVTATHLAVSPVANVRAGDAFNATVEARDANNNRAENFTGSVSISAAATGGSNFVGGTQNVAAVAGTAGFVGLVLNNAADGYTITASSAGLTSGLSNSFNVTARQLLFATVVPNHQAGSPFGVAVQFLDGNGVLAENFTGNVSLDATAAIGGSNFVGGTQTAAAAAGTATFSNLALNDAADGYRITASASSAGILTSATSNTFNVTATHLAVLAVANVQAGDLFNVTVQARDANNNVAENFTGNVAVNAAATGGSNFVGGTQNVAAVAGTASFVGVSLNDAADGYTITASSAGLTSGVSNSFNVGVDVVQLTVTSVVANMQAGTLFNVTVQARDANGVLAENFTGTVNLDAAAIGGSNFVGGTQTAAATGGIATFSNLALNNAADNYAITASAPGVLSGVSNSFNVTATHLAVLAVPNLRAGDLFNVTVQARDANNNVAENFTGNVAVNAAATGGSNFVGGTQNVAAVAGTASFVGVSLNDAADGYTITANSAGLTSGVSNSFNVTALQLTVTSVVANMQAGTLFNVTVQARDANNNVAENFTGTVNLDAAAIGGSNFVGGTQTAAATGGIATFSNLALNNAADNYAITASAPGLLSGVSNSFNVTATHLAVLAVPNLRAGDLFNVTVQARDANNNVAENFTGNVAVNAAATGGSNFVGGTQNVAAVAGTASFVGVSLNDAADGYTITASSAGLTSGVSNSFNVGVDVVQLTVTSVVANMQAGTLFNVTVQARDANGVLAENFTGTVNLDAAAIGGSNFVGGTQTAAATGGIATFSNLALNNAADNYAITASAPGPLSGVSNSFNVTATHLAVLAVPNLRAGDLFNVTVQARDANNNVAENFTGNVALNAAATGGSNFVGGTQNVAAVAGTASFVGVSLNDAADGYTITANSAGLTDGVSNSFNVTALQLTVTSVVANMQAGTLFNVTVQARDANNNVAENFTGTVNLNAAAIGGSNFVGGTQTATATAGIATFSNLALNDAADNYAITASAPGLLSGVSNSFNVTATVGQSDISIDDVTVTEGNSGTTSATFTVTLSQAATSQVTVDFATASASATGGIDFVDGSGTLTFAPGVTSQTIPVTVKGDLLNESDEIFTVNLTGAVNASIVDGQGVGTIQNDDPAPVISVQPALAVEGSLQPRSVTLRVRLSAPSGQQVLVAFQTADGTAVDGVGEASSDYTANTGTLVFAPGDTEQSITISLRNDLVIEADEHFFVDLRTPVNALIATPRTPVVIVDDDAPVRQLVALAAQVLTLDLDVFRKINLLLNVRLDCNALREFTRDVTRYRGTYITPADADSLNAAANRLRLDIGCRP